MGVRVPPFAPGTTNGPPQVTVPTSVTAFELIGTNDSQVFVSGSPFAEPNGYTDDYSHCAFFAVPEPGSMMLFGTGLLA